MGKGREPASAASVLASRPHEPASPVAPELGDRLKVMFGEISGGPTPARILDLADRLEEAFQRGELFKGCGRRRAS